MRRAFNHSESYHSESCQPLDAASLFIGAASNFLSYPFTPSRAELSSVETPDSLLIMHGRRVPTAGRTHSAKSWHVASSQCRQNEGESIAKAMNI